MKFLKIISISSLALLMGACSPEKPDINWATADSCTLKLVAYRTAKVSSYWMEEAGTGAIFEFRGLGGRRIPTVALGSVVSSKCAWSKNIRHTDWHSKKINIVKHHSGTTVFKYSAGYKNKTY